MGEMLVSDGRNANESQNIHNVKTSKKRKKNHKVSVLRKNKNYTVNIFCRALTAILFIKKVKPRKTINHRRHKTGQKNKRLGQRLDFTRKEI